MKNLDTFSDGKVQTTKGHVRIPMCVIAVHHVSAHSHTALRRQAQACVPRRLLRYWGLMASKVEEERSPSGRGRWCDRRLFFFFRSYFCAPKGTEPHVARPPLRPPTCGLYLFVVPPEHMRAHLVARKHGDIAQKLEVPTQDRRSGVQ